ncbi:hypothetical protein Y032_0118g745 [Ancylostoma ceylanicum]|uniref:SCP domain-containing protein n=1 Tax=Ancylostoma ceylanicum TaxID=53326 RepID=A0A016TBN8_9BILA|nr:hypothetical protein Y032_0118g745 [Ancylostoma ceylanicum]
MASMFPVLLIALALLQGRAVTGQPNPAQPNPAQPNPAQPNPAQPNPAQPNPAQPNPAQPNPAQPNPAQPNPAQPNPAQPNPAQPNPAQPNPAQPNPAQPNPAQPNPAQPNPAQPNPAQPNPAQPNPAQPNPAQPNPAQPNPAQPNPAQPNPAQPNPAQPNPAQPNPAQPNPAQPNPAQPNPAQPNPAQPNPAQPNPAQPNPAQPNPVQPNPAQPNPAQPNPAQPNPAQPNPAQPNPAQPNPAQPNPAQPNPAQPNPAQPNPAQPNPAQPNPPPVTRAPWPKPNCGNPKLNNGLRQLFLNMHNNFRGSVARGQTETSFNWGIAPPATIMYRMKYSCDAESYAQQYIASCNTNGLPAHTHPGYKVNRHVLRNVQTNMAGAAQNAITSWWSQLARFGMRSNMMFYASERQRGARNVLSWSKVCSASVLIPKICRFRFSRGEEIFRWLGGITTTLVVLCKTVDRSITLLACTNQVATMSINMSIRWEQYVPIVRRDNAMVRLCAVGENRATYLGILFTSHKIKIQSKECLTCKQHNSLSFGTLRVQKSSRQKHSEEA